MDFDYNSVECMSQITNNIFISDYYSSITENLLTANNIKYILNMCCEEKAEHVLRMYKDLGIVHKQIAIDDDPDENIIQYFPAIIEFMRNSRNGNVLVHCWAGVSRSATAVILYLLWLYISGFQCTVPRTINATAVITNYVRSKRSIIRPNYGFMSQLCLFENQMRIAHQGNPRCDCAQQRTQRRPYLDLRSHVGM